MHGQQNMKKGNSIVILLIQQYEPKIRYFLQTNSLQTTSTDPTKRYQTQIRTKISNSKTPIPQDFRWKYINLNPSAPTIKGLIKNTQTRPALSNHSELT